MQGHRRDHALPAAARAIAALEAFKGLLAMAAALGLLGLLHPAPRHAAVALISHAGLPTSALHPVGAMPRHLVLSALGHARTTLGLLLAYAVIHLAEAYGLWRGRAWGAILGVASGSLYIPLELQHVLHRPTATAAVVVLLNAIVVAVLLRRALRVNAGDGLVARNRSEGSA